jgi:hypothetical protein
MKFNNEGTPLPDPKDPSRLPDYGRDNGREFIPTQSDYSRDVIGSKQTGEDARVRNVQREQYADFHRRRFGRAITEAEYPENLRSKGQDLEDERTGR